MKAALLTAVNSIEMGEIPKPSVINNNEVLVKVKMVGICGSDLHYYHTGRIGDQIIRFPFVAGHEATGVVEETGKLVSRVKPGQRIAIDPAYYCGKCDQCRAGRENTCENLLFLGCPGQLEGALKEYLIVDEKCCYPIGDNLTYEQAVLSEPLAIAVYAAERTLFQNDPNTAILGAGPIGMSVFHVLHHKNVKNVFITDKIEDRIKFSELLEPKYTGNPNKVNIIEEIKNIEPKLMDIVYECSGDADAFIQGIRLLKPGGTLVIIGIPEADNISIPIHELRRKEITVINIRRQANCTQTAIDHLNNGTINMDSMVTHHFNLEETAKAFDLVSGYGDGVMKAMVKLD
jgi:L-iditol 2-dehydrogenase